MWGLLRCSPQSKVLLATSVHILVYAKKLELRKLLSKHNLSRLHTGLSIHYIRIEPPRQDTPALSANSSVVYINKSFVYNMANAATDQDTPASATNINNSLFAVHLK